MFAFRNRTIIRQLIPLYTQFTQINSFTAKRTLCTKPPPFSSRIPPQELIDVMKLNPELSKFGEKNVLKVHDTFVQAGFETQSILRIIIAYPSLLRYPPKNLLNRIEIWRGCQFGDRHLTELLEQCPELLDFNDEQVIRKRMADLKVMAHTTRNIWRLLMASPNVLTDNILALKAKEKYMREVMKVDVTDIVKSGSFSHPLQKIKTRHMLLVRLGIYKERTKHYNELDPNKNPRMARIMDSSNEDFASKICGISLLEYESFEELYARELKNKGDTTISGGAIETDEDSDESDEEDDDVDDDVDYSKERE